MTERVEIVLTATDNASGTIGRVGASLRSLGRGTAAMSQLGTILGRGFGAAAANLERYAVRMAMAGGIAGAASVKWAVDFEKNMALLETQAGAAHSEVVNMTSAVRSLASTTASNPIDLAKMLYHIESAGIRGAQALEILRVASLGVKVGIVTDFESVTNAMIAVQQSGIGGVKDMSQAMSVLDGIIGSGNMRMADLADAMSTGILGTSKAFGVNLQSIGAALALLTDTGVPANSAATRLTHSIVMMAAPTLQAQKILKGLGMSQFDLAKDLKKPNGIMAALTDLRTHLEKHGGILNGKMTVQGANAVAKMFGGSRFSATILQLIEALPLLQQKYDGVIAKQDSFGERVSQTSKTAAFQFDQLFANIQNIGISLGDALLPGLEKINGALNTFIGQNGGGLKALATDVGSWFSTFTDKMMQVDWGSVADSFGKIAGGAGDLIQAFMGAPDWVKGVLVGGFAMNKLTGGMVTDLAGWGIKNGIGAIFGAAGSAVGGTAGAVIGSAGAQRVFVTNWPLGGVGGIGGSAGAGGGISGAAGQGSAAFILRLAKVVGGGLLAYGGSSLLQSSQQPGSGNSLTGTMLQGVGGAGAMIGGGALMAGPVGAMLASLFAVFQTQQQQSSNSSAQAGGLMATLKSKIGSMSPTDLAQALAGVNSGISGISGNPLNMLVAGDSLDTLKAMQSILEEQLRKTPDYRSWDTHSEAIATAAANSVANKLGYDSTNAAYNAMYRDSPQNTLRRVEAKIAGITKRSIAKYGHTPPKSWVDATFGRNELRAAEKIEHSNMTTAEKITELTQIQKELKAHGDTKTAAKISQAIRGLSQSVTVNVAVTAASVARATTVSARYGVVVHSGTNGYDII